MKFKDLKSGAVFAFKEKPNSLCLLSYNREKGKNDVVFLSGNCHNAGQIYDAWKEKEVREFPHIKQVLQTLANGLPGIY